MTSTDAVRLNESFQLEPCQHMLPQREIDEITIDVLAVGLNPVDYKFKNGAIPIELPCILGHECLGVVLDADDKSLTGKKVIVYLPGPHTQSSGAMCRRLNVPLDFVAVVPDDASPEYAAYPLCGLVAQRCFNRIKNQNVRNCFVAGVTGGVGWLFAQLCRKNGIALFTCVRSTSSQHKIEAFFGQEINCFVSENVLSGHAVVEAFGRQHFDACADFVGGEFKTMCLQLCDFNAQFLTIVEEGPGSVIDLLDARKSPAFQKSLCCHFEFLGAQAYFGTKEDRACYAKELDEMKTLIMDRTFLYPTIKTFRGCNVESLEAGLRQLENREDPSVNKFLIVFN